MAKIPLLSSSSSSSPQCFFLAPTPAMRPVRDMGTNGSPLTRVLEALIKWTRPVRSPTNLQVGSETLSTTPVTLEDPRRPHPDPGIPVGLVAQDSPLGRGAAPPVRLRIAVSAL
jgi:hypothetical protein